MRCSNYLEESELGVESHDGVVIKIFGQRHLVDFDGALKSKHTGIMQKGP
jgi:hypothetical protein